MLSCHISPAPLHGDRHGHIGVLIECREVMIRIDDLNLIIHCQLTCCQFTGPLHVNRDGLGSITVKLRRDLLQIQDNFGNIFLDTGDRGKLMLYPFNMDAGCSNSG